MASREPIGHVQLPIKNCPKGPQYYEISYYEVASTMNIIL